MQNPFGSSEFPSYSDLQKRIHRHMQDGHVEEQTTALIVKSFEDFLGGANLVLSRPERKRLLAQAVDALFEDVKARLDISTRGGE